MFHHMRYIYEVYRQKSFSKAAEKLYIAQPSLSAMVKKAEIRVGAPIFDRSTSPVRLTECGQEYIKCVERIMDIEAGFENYISDTNNLKTGSITIGASYFFTSYILPPHILKFQNAYPNVNVNIVEAGTTELERKLFAGDLDLIVDNSLLDEQIYSRILFYRERMVLAVPDSFSPGKIADAYRLTAEDLRRGRHTASATPAPPLSLFADAPYVLLRHGNNTRDRAEAVFAEQDIRPPVSLEVDQIVTAYHAACRGLGIAFVSDTLAREAVHDAPVSYYKIDSPHTLRENYFYHKRNKYVTRAMHEFLRLTLAQ